MDTLVTIFTTDDNKLKFSYDGNSLMLVASDVTEIQLDKKYYNIKLSEASANIFLNTCEELVNIIDARKAAEGV